MFIPENKDIVLQEKKKKTEMFLVKLDMLI
jgi:hypothetical protein